MLRYGKMLLALALMGALGLLLAPQARAQTAGDLACKGCVGKGDLAKNAVTKAKLKKNAVTGAKIKKNAVTGAKIKNGTVALGDLSPAVRQLIADLQARVAALEAQAGVLADLAAFITVDEVPTDLDGDGTIDPASELLPRVLFEGVNVQVVNGDPLESTDSLNGLGNLIVGYNEPRPAGNFVCSDGRFADNDPVTGCKDMGHVWAPNHKSGSHNLVVGRRNAYSQTGGVVFGESNAVNRRAASVTGGLSNIASGFDSSVSGGIDNTASGTVSSVSGGNDNLASGFDSSVSGGSSNTADGQFSSVSGGNNVTIPVSGNCNWGGEDMVFGNATCDPP